MYPLLSISDCAARVFLHYSTNVEGLSYTSTRPSGSLQPIRKNGRFALPSLLQLPILYNILLPYARQLAMLGASTHAKCCWFVNVAPHENFQPGRFQSWKELCVSLANARYSVKRVRA
jgi:hypothetical protein